MRKTYTLPFHGRTLTVEVGKLANLANGSALVRYGDTVVLATAVMSKDVKEDLDYFPLSCDYEEKFYAAGRISGSRFIKREGRPSEEAILSARLIDRTIRPRFDHRMRNEVQVVATVLAFDGENDPDFVALLGSSIALGISDIPWNGPVAGARIGEIDGVFVVNPTYKEREKGELDLMVSGLATRLNMIEAGAKETQETDLLQALQLAEENIKTLIEFENTIIAENARPKSDVPLSNPSKELTDLFDANIALKLENAMYANVEKAKKYAMLDDVAKEWKQLVLEKFGDAVHGNTVDFILHEKTNDLVHEKLLKEGARPDGRKANELRALSSEVAVLPRVHGSGIFQRGETQILSVLTLGAPSDEQIFDTMEGESKRRFMHHYNHARFSTGEVGRMGNPGRREIGHAALAEHAISAIIPNQNNFPYTIRLVSETLTSNGSTSMASVCASSLALMDGGVPIAKHVGGIAMGLMMDEKGNYKVLTDIQGPEDHHGDMDFKVAGTKDGVTALQMDVKIEGVTIEVLKDALSDAKAARLQILGVMESAIAAHRPDLAATAPRIVTFKINPEKIRDLIGPGGKVINEIIDTTGAHIDVEDDGTVFVTAPGGEAGERAVEWIKRITKEILPGEILGGVVTRLFDFGAMVEVGPKQEGLIHISELAPYRVERVTDIVNIGDELTVKVKDIDSQGRINLSLKDVPGRYSEEEVAAYKAAHPFQDMGSRPRPFRERRGGSPTFRREDRDRRRHY